MEKMIDGVKVKNLRTIPDDRGRLMEILRNDDEIYQKFGQVYMTTVYPGVVKAWHYHKIQSDNIVVLSGMAKIALYDARENSPTYKTANEFYMGIHNPILLHVPPYIYHGFENITDSEILILNIPDEVYNYENPDEHRVDPFNNDIPVKWKANFGR